MGLKLAGVMFILMLAMGGLMYWYYNDTQEKMAILHENNAKLETATKVQKQAIEDMERQVELVNNIAKQTQDQLVESRKKIEVINNKFNKQSRLLGSRDIGKLAISKPRVITKIVDKASLNVLRCFEIVSG